MFQERDPPEDAVTQGVADAHIEVVDVRREVEKVHEAASGVPACALEPGVDMLLAALQHHACRVYEKLFCWF